MRPPLSPCGLGLGLGLGIRGRNWKALTFPILPTNHGVGSSASHLSRMGFEGRRMLRGAHDGQGEGRDEVSGKGSGESAISPSQRSLNRLPRPQKIY